MDRHLILPIALSAGLHAGVLFGSHRGAVPTPPPESEIIKVERITIPQEIDPPELVRNDEVKPAKGSPMPPLPTIEDTSPPRPEAIPMPVTKVPVEIPEDVKRIPTDTFGVEHGVVGGAPRADFSGVLDLDNAPRTRAQVAPIYPPSARASGLMGEVVVEFTVDENGGVVDPHVMRSSDRVFEEATLRAIAKWRFEPGRRHGRVVRFKMAVPVSFNLNN